MTKINDKQIVTIEKKIIPLVEMAKAFKIKDQDDMKKATELLSKMNQIIDKVTEDKEKIAKPLNEALKEVRGRYKPVETIYEEGVEAIRHEISAYQTEQVRIQKEDAQKIADRVGEGKGKLKVETAIRKIDEIATPKKEVATQSGLVQFRETPTLKITDLAKIPREYFTLNEKKTLDALKAGVEIPGCEVEIIQTPVNYR